MLAWFVPGVPVPTRPRWAQPAGCSPLTLRSGQERRGRPGTRGWLRALTDSDLVCLPSPSEALGRPGRVLLVTSSDSPYVLYRMSISMALISPWNLSLECPNSLPWTLVVLTEKKFWCSVGFMSSLVTAVGGQ